MTATAVVSARLGSIAAFFIVRLIAGSMAALAPMLMAQGAAAQDVRAAIQKANLYIEVAKMTERAVEFLGPLRELGEHEDRADRQGTLHLLRHVRGLRSGRPA